MSSTKEPMLWLARFFSHLLFLSTLQLIAGVLTVALIASPLPSGLKHVSILCTIFLLAVAFRATVDHRTHLLAVMLASLSLLFTVPLNALALITQCNRGRHPPARLRTILRVSFPIGVPSPKRHAERPSRQCVRGAAYLALTVLVTAPLFLRVRDAGGLRMHVAVSAAMFTGVPAVLNLCAAVAGLLGAPSPSPFHAPFLAPSLGAFWAGRWNAPVSHALRVGVYDPLCEAGVSPALAVLACFAVSGAAHEAIMIYSHAYGSGGRCMAFFTLHGVLVVAERAASARWRWFPPPGWQRWLLVAPIMFVSFATLFVSAAQRTGLDLAAVESFSELARVAAAAIALIKSGSK